MKVDTTTKKGRYSDPKPKGMTPHICEILAHYREMYSVSNIYKEDLDNAIELHKYVFVCRCKKEKEP